MLNGLELEILSDESLDFISRDRDSDMDLCSRYVESQGLVESF